MTTQSTRSRKGGSRSDFEPLGRWQTNTGNWLELKARRKTGYASVWLDYNGHMVKVGYVLHASGVVRKVCWEAPWAEQTDAWKSQQRNHISSLVASWHAEVSRPATPVQLPASVVGTFEFDGFRFAVEPTTAPEHLVLSVLNAANGLTPVADLLHDGGRICGMATRPGWKGTPEGRKRRWRREAEVVLGLAVEQGRL